MKAEASKWQRVPLVELCEKHVDCVNRTAPVVSEPTPYKMIRTTNVRDGYIDTENVRYVTEDTYKKWTRRLVPKRGDVILTREAPLGGVGKLRTDDHIFLGQRLYHFRPHSEKLDSDFLLYALMAPGLQGQIMGFGSGSTVEHMRLGDIPSLEINVPPLPVQRRIAGILSAYDELIENSQRRIRLLEDMARALYREWFVHFRFPGHESVPRLPSALGDIPQGWEWRKLSDLGFVGRGKSRHRPRNDASLYGGPYPFYQTGDIKDARVFLRSYSQTYSEAGLAQSKLWAPGTLCITIAANIADTAIMAEEGCFPDSVVGFIPDNSKSNAFYVKTYLDSIKERMQNASRGTTQDNLSVEKLLGFLVLTPPLPLMQLFGERVSPMLRQLNILLQKEDNLRRTRDLLLPRLLAVSSSIPIS